MNNPYSPPQAPAPPAASRGPRVFGPLAVAIHFLLVPIAGALMAAVNHQRVRDTAGTLRALALFLVPAIGMIWFNMAARMRSQWVLLLFVRVALTAMIYVEQKPFVEAWRARGARKARWWLVWLLPLPAAVVGLAVWQVLSPAERH